MGEMTGARTAERTDGSGVEAAYIFGSDSDLGQQHVALLEHLFDPTTREALQEVGLRPGQRCLEVGAGGGSIARWMAEQVGPTGSVLAVDLETEHVVEQPGVEVRRHDIRDGAPDDGPFDLIHARLVLPHLPERERILRDLVAALAPGGWLVLGEMTDRHPEALAAPSSSDLALFSYMQHLSMDVVSPASGLSFEWGVEAPGQMVAAGLVEISGVEQSHTSAGGSAGSLLHRNLNIQAEPLLRQAGATTAQLERYRELMLDPAFVAWFYQFVCLRGRRPA
ncbi:MAG: class I SAM-dependent methyltransferase [Janibacter sp.]